MYADHHWLRPRYAAYGRFHAACPPGMAPAQPFSITAALQIRDEFALVRCGRAVQAVLSAALSARGAGDHSSKTPSFSVRRCASPEPAQRSGNSRCVPHECARKVVPWVSISRCVRMCPKVPNRVRPRTRAFRTPTSGSLSISLDSAQAAAMPTAVLVPARESRRDRTRRQLLLARRIGAASLRPAKDPLRCGIEIDGGPAVNGCVHIRPLNTLASASRPHGLPPPLRTPPASCLTHVRTSRHDVATSSVQAQTGTDRRTSHREVHDHVAVGAALDHGPRSVHPVSSVRPLSAAARTSTPTCAIVRSGRTPALRHYPA